METLSIRIARAESCAWNRLELLTRMREALTEGVTEYRLLRGGEPYKYRLANADPGLESVAIARGARGNAALAVALFITRWRASRSRGRAPDPA